jgi:NAD(P)H-dependent FMN reductase
MPTIAAIAGSLRNGSYNKGLVRAAIELAPDGLDVEEVFIGDIPLFNADIEAEGVPKPVVRAKEVVAGADALLLATPEYNNSMPGVLKNAIDWLSRPPRHSPQVFRGKPIGLIGATTGGWGTKLSQTAWLQVVRALRMRPFHGRSMYVSHARDLFDSDGSLIDPETRERLTGYLADFGEFIARGDP